MRSRIATSVALCVILAASLPTMYVLTIGPASIAVRRGAISYETFFWLYDPVFNLTSRCSPFGTYLKWYLTVWGHQPEEEALLE
jgi:hypothetical protein